jgi:hypothetical protein
LVFDVTLGGLVAVGSAQPVTLIALGVRGDRRSLRY